MSDAIADLESKIENLEDRIDNLNDRISEKNDEISTLESENSDLEDKVKELEKYEPLGNQIEEIFSLYNSVWHDNIKEQRLVDEIKKIKFNMKM